MQRASLDLPDAAAMILALRPTLPMQLFFAGPTIMRPCWIHLCRSIHCGFKTSRSFRGIKVPAVLPRGYYGMIWVLCKSKHRLRSLKRSSPGEITHDGPNAVRKNESADMQPSYTTTRDDAPTPKLCYRMGFHRVRWCRTRRGDRRLLIDADSPSKTPTSGCGCDRRDKQASRTATPPLTRRIPATTNFLKASNQQR